MNTNQKVAEYREKLRNYEEKWAKEAKTRQKPSAEELEKYVQKSFEKWLEERKRRYL